MLHEVIAGCEFQLARAWTPCQSKTRCHSRISRQQPQPLVASQEEGEDAPAEGQQVVSTRIVPPSASALIAALRGVGYSLETAIADIVDNSIAAEAKRIDIQWEWQDGNPTASILDDGSGMPEARLVEAMRFGGVGPEAPRGD